MAVATANRSSSIKTIIMGKVPKATSIIFIRALLLLSVTD
jgi:hypothetical protein